MITQILTYIDYPRFNEKSNASRQDERILMSNVWECCSSMIDKHVILRNGFNYHKTIIKKYKPQ